MKIACAFLASVLFLPVFAKNAPPTKTGAVDDKIVVLEPMKITGTPIISFAVNIRIYMDPDTRKVDRLFITKVWPDSDAERAGLQVGDEILTLDGKAVREFDAQVSVNTPLGKIFLDRAPGEPLKLEVITRRTEKVTLRARHPGLEDRLR